MSQKFIRLRDFCDFLFEAFQPEVHLAARWRRRSDLMSPFDRPMSISYWCPIDTFGLSLTVFMLLSFSVWSADFGWEFPFTVFSVILTLMRSCPLKIALALRAPRRTAHFEPSIAVIR